MDGKNTKNLPISKEEVLQKYKQFHTDPKSETRKEWKSLVTTLREYLATEKYFKKFKYFDFNGLLYELSTKSEDTSTRKGVFFKDLFKALQKLEDYGLKLLKRPWRREFYTIKLFTTFYKHEIESIIPNAPAILGLYGYKEQSQNILKVTSPLDLDKILNVSFELFLASIELEVLFKIWSNIEEYTDDFSLSSVIELRGRTLGDVKEALESFLDGKTIIKKAKRIKTDELEAAEKSKLRRAAEVEDSSAVDPSNWKVSQAKSKRDTKYPPTYDTSHEYSRPVDIGVTAVGTKARVQHISSSSIDNFTDAELYGHTNASPSSRDKENHIPMETEEHTSPSTAADYDSNPYYVDMSGAGYDDYEMMDMYGATNGDASCTTLPPPPDYQYHAHDPGIPPPTYSQAAQIPGNDWVMVQDHQFGREDKHSDPLTNTIPGFSAMNIGGNRLGSGSRFSSEVLSRSTYDTNKLPPSKTSKTLSAEKLHSNAHSHLESVRLEGNTRSRTFSAPESKDAMRQREVSSKPPITNGLDYRSPSFSTRELDKRKLYENVNLHSEKPEDSLKSRADSEGRSGSLGMYENIPTSKTKDQYPASGVTRTESRERRSKAIRDTHVITTTEPLTTASYYKGTSATSVTSSLSSYQTPRTGVTTRSQAKEIVANKPSSEPSQQSSSSRKVTKKSTKDNCFVCSNKATHYCESCDKRSCKDCLNVVTRLPCESYKEHHFVEGRPTSSKDQKNRCSFCDAKTPSHMCIYCRKHSCENCHTVYKTDHCSKESELHYFVDEESQKLSSERKEATSLATPVSKDSTPHPSSISGENICDFCGLAANLICKTCLKPVCNTCVYVYKQDLCPPTKKEHQFENIVAQSSNTNGTPHKDSDSAWACERCTFLNSPSHRICAVCAASRGVKEAEAFPESGTRRCANCTYGNEQGATVCKMCSCTIGLDRPESYI